MVSVDLDKITKKFGKVIAVNSVSLSVNKGSIHAILGENGAGKTTLMNVLYGLYRPDKGIIRINGNKVDIDSTRKALTFGIGMIHQHFTLISPLTVTENIILGLKEKSIFIDRKKHAKGIAKLNEDFGFDIDPFEQVSKLSIGMQQRVEILKLLYRNTEILILDEPTSVLSLKEISSLFHVLNRLKNSGKTILFITHKLGEVIKIADHATVMRNGKVISSIKVADTNPKELAQLMVGREVVLDIPKIETKVGSTVLEVKNLHTYDEKDVEALKEVSLNLNKGEILGIAGVDGNGQTELVEVIFGIRRNYIGEVLIKGKEIRNLSIANRRNNLGIGYIPADRQGVGLVITQNVATNLILNKYKYLPFSNHGFLNKKTISSYAKKLIKEYDIRLSDLNQEIQFLSGGNQQKTILAREFSNSPSILIIAQPCRGLDVGATEFVLKTLIDQKKKGISILYISTEIEYLLSVCDRIAVMYRGQIMGILPRETATFENLGLLMMGLTSEDS